MTESPAKMNANLERFLALPALHFKLASKPGKLACSPPTEWGRLVQACGLVGLTSDDCGWDA